MENLRTVAARVAAGIQTWARINTGNGLAVTRAEQSVNVLLFFLLSSAALNDLMRTVSIVDSIAVLSLHLRLNETLLNYKKSLSLEFQARFFRPQQNVNKIYSPVIYEVAI